VLTSVDALRARKKALLAALKAQLEGIIT